MKAFLALFLLSFIAFSYGRVDEQFKSLSHSKLRSLYAKHYDGYKKFTQKYKTDVEDERPEPYRLLAYAKTVEKIKLHNELYKQGKTTFKLGLNHMADMTHEEFQALNPEVNINITPQSFNKTTIISEIPKTVNWEKKGFLSPVKKLTGTCYGGGGAAAVAGALEAMDAILTERLVPLSAQQILDCTNYTCSKLAVVEEIFKSVYKQGGLNSESDYPWKGKTEQCKFKKGNLFGTMRGYLLLQPNSTETLKAAIAQRPVAVTIFSNSEEFRNYKGGIFRDNTVKFGRYSHVMLAVGYGEDYILLKNSWGADWGEKGYMRITTDIEANDNVCNFPVQPF